MGLMYALPISLDEQGFAEVKGNKLFLRSYGLPYIFWIYLLCAFIFYALLCVFSFKLLTKMYQMGGIDQTLSYFFALFLVLLPLITLGFFFFYKEIQVTKKSIFIKNNLFFIPIKKMRINGTNITLQIVSHLDSANIAKQNPTEDNIGFQNKGYFILLAISESQRLFIDRSSSKSDLTKIKTMIEKFI